MTRAQLCSGRAAAAIVRAARLAWPARGSRASSFVLAIAAPIAFVGAAPASAQVGIAASVFSDDRFRGYSLSDDRPVAILDVSYDAPDGLYGAASGIFVASRDDGIQPLGIELNAGYAKTLKSGVALDVGVTRSSYSHYSSRGPGKSYTEGYVGLAGKLLSARLSASPDYLKFSTWTVYGELNGHVPIGSKLRLIAHVGLLVPFRPYHADQDYRREFDWRLGIAKDIGRATLSAAWTGVHRGQDIYQDPERPHSAFVVGLTYAL